jgi:hypothetical protein
MAQIDGEQRLARALHRSAFAAASSAGNSKDMPTAPTLSDVATPYALSPESTAGTAPLPAGDILLGALIAAASDLCDAMPRLQNCRVLAFRDSLPPGLVGAYVPVLGSDHAIHVGLLSDVCSCDELARMRETAQTLSGLDTRTALSELTHALAARLAYRANPQGRLAVGPAVFVDGIARRTRSVGVRAAEVAFADTRATLVLVGSEALIQSEWPGAERRTHQRSESEPA